MSNQKQKISFEEWKAHRKVSKILAEDSEQEEPGPSDFTETDAAIEAWAGKGSRLNEADADIEAWAKANK